MKSSQTLIQAKLNLKSYPSPNQKFYLRSSLSLSPGRSEKYVRLQLSCLSSYNGYSIHQKVSIEIIELQVWFKWIYKEKEKEYLVQSQRKY